jgi:hypothetical protein
LGFVFDAFASFAFFAVWAGGWHIFSTGGKDLMEGVGLTQRKNPVVWTIAAILLWIVAGAVDRRTGVEIFSSGGQLHVEVAGTTLSAPMTIERLAAVEVRAMDSIDPPGGGRITVTSDRGEVANERLPRRFRLPTGLVAPVGDWELDDFAGQGSVWKRAVAVTGPFTINARFCGRFHYGLEVVLHGVSGASVAIRRGLINHDIFIRSADGTTLAVTSLDPTPAADIGAVAATLLRATAIASLLIAVFAVLEFLSRPTPKATASRRWNVMPWAAALALAATVLSTWVAREVLEGLPHLPDSVTYLLQARWLLAGDLWGTVAAFQDHLDVPYTYVVGERWLGHYPQGWPVLLAIGIAVGAPWLIAPILGGLFVMLLYLTGRELDGEVTGLLAATLGVLSPMARLIFGSMLSHAAASTLIVAGLWLLLRARRLKTWPAAALSGITLGLAFGVRPLSAAAVAIPLAVVVAADLFARRDRESRDRFVAWVAGGAAAALPTLVANHLITGSACSFPYSLAKGSMYFASNLPFGIRNTDVLLYSAGNVLHGWGWPLFYGPFWVALAFAFALVPFLLRRNSGTDLLLAAMVGSGIVALLGSRGHGLHGFGPRYLFEVFAPLYLLTAKGFVELARQSFNGHEIERRLHIAASGLLFIILCTTAALALPHRLGLYRGYNGVNGALEEQVAEAGLEHAVVLLPPENWRGWAMAARIFDPDPDADLLFIQAEPDDLEVPVIAGDRPIYAWRNGTLTAAD